MKIVLVGGGTGGPITPLLAVREAILARAPGAEFYYLGANSALERKLIERERLPYYVIPAGKFRRYFDWRTAVDIFKIAVGFFKSFALLRRLKPEVIFSAGSFVAVPVAYAAFLLRIKIVIHQQDVTAGLANKLVYPIADRVTVSLPKSQGDFYSGSGLFKSKKSSKITLTGNPVRARITSGSIARARQLFSLSDKLPTLLVLGGGSGAARLNELVWENSAELTKSFQVIHLTGLNKNFRAPPLPNYHPYPFLTDELPHALKIADIVVSRAGFSTISELAACKKAAILVPMPQSHQVQNAVYLAVNQAALIAPQEALGDGVLVRVLRKLLFDHETRKTLSTNIAKIMPPHAAERVAEVILSVSPSFSSPLRGEARRDSARQARRG